MAASTTKASKTMSIETTLSAGGWSSESTFRKHYDLPVMEYKGIDKALLSK